MINLEPTLRLRIAGDDFRNEVTKVAARSVTLEALPMPPFPDLPEQGFTKMSCDSSQT